MSSAEIIVSPVEGKAVDDPAAEFDHERVVLAATGHLHRERDQGRLGRRVEPVVPAFLSAKGELGHLVGLVDHAAAAAAVVVPAGHELAEGHVTAR